MPEPFHDCPRCPRAGCNGPLCTTLYAGCNAAARARHYNLRLFCPACGDGFDGTDAEYAQALAADRAWEIHEGRDPAPRVGVPVMTIVVRDSP